MAVDISEAKVKRNEFGLWLGWTLATAAGMLLGLPPLLLLIEELDLWLTRILAPLWAGLLLGLLQWLVLRRYLTHSMDWIMNAVAGWGLGYSLGLILIQALSGSPGGALLGYLAFGVYCGGGTMADFAARDSQLVAVAARQCPRLDLGRSPEHACAQYAGIGRTAEPGGELCRRFRDHRPGCRRRHRCGVGLDRTPAGALGRSVQLASREDSMYRRQTSSGGRGGCTGRLLMAGLIVIGSLVMYFGSRQDNPVTGETQYIDLSVDQEIALGLQAAQRWPKSLAASTATRTRRRWWIGSAIVWCKIRQRAGHPISSSSICSPITRQSMPLRCPAARCLSRGRCWIA